MLLTSFYTFAGFASYRCALPALLCDLTTGLWLVMAVSGMMLPEGIGRMDAVLCFFASWVLSPETTWPLHSTCGIVNWLGVLVVHLWLCIILQLTRTG